MNAFWWWWWWWLLLPCPARRSMKDSRQQKHQQQSAHIASNLHSSIRSCTESIYWAFTWVVFACSLIDTEVLQMNVITPSSFCSTWPALYWTECCMSGIHISTLPCRNQDQRKHHIYLRHKGGGVHPCSLLFALPGHGQCLIALLKSLFNLPQYKNNLLFHYSRV